MLGQGSAAGFAIRGVCPADKAALATFCTLHVVFLVIGMKEAGLTGAMCVSEVSASALQGEGTGNILLRCGLNGQQNSSN
jgi:hypothetical protein